MDNGHALENVGVDKYYQNKMYNESIHKVQGYDMEKTWRSIIYWEIIWIQRLVEQLRHKKQNLVVYCDNQNVLHMQEILSSTPRQST